MLILKLLLKMILRTIRDQNAVNGSSLYKLLTYYTNISIATAYRKITDLITWGYIARVNKNHYLITAKGLIAMALLCINKAVNDDETCQDTILLLKHEWDLDEFDNESIRAYLKLLTTKVSSYGLDPLQVLPSLGFPKSVLLLVPSNLHHMNSRTMLDLMIEELGNPNEGLVMKAQGIIAKALMLLLPTTTLEDGCRAVTISGRVIAIKCRAKGYTLDSRCPIFTRSINTR
ncbi:hypothetical protein [Vulcanisaeta sp. JCM 14467]|uniref:hypothetical protein n=1 Tax=Vulcanisaeta sp. JCM 14467 TaxID=1295370 RepID=UPI00209239EC|nr:hypothetical protein [Vulcanisaeta sp. JCM 14467]